MNLIDNNLKQEKEGEKQTKCSRLLPTKARN